MNCGIDDVIECKSTLMLKTSNDRATDRPVVPFTTLRAEQVCEKCPEIHRQRVADTIQISVDPGERDGEEFLFYDEGEPVVDGEPGDLRVVLQEVPHRRFQRHGDNLHMFYTISLGEALTGFKHEVAHLDGHTFFIESTEYVARSNGNMPCDFAKARAPCASMVSMHLYRSRSSKFFGILTAALRGRSGHSRNINVHAVSSPTITSLRSQARACRNVGRTATSRRRTSTAISLCNLQSRFPISWRRCSKLSSGRYSWA